LEVEEGSDTSSGEEDRGWNSAYYIVEGEL
jgi:hypothetical protein